jgi:hypothetical protein
MSEVRNGTSRNTENENKRCKIFNKVLNMSDILCTEMSHKEKSCSIFLNQHNSICSKFNKLYNYNINILQNKQKGNKKKTKKLKKIKEKFIRQFGSVFNKTNG